MSEPTKAVFLSYASQDALAAMRICEALRAAGVEVWFDQNELVGGDAWDQKIRKQIKECALLIPIISAATQARREGYFRLEWRLADQRTHLMAKGLPFLLPVVIDDTRDTDAHVPDSFTEVQWTRLLDGETPPAFAERVRKLLGGLAEVGQGSRPVGSAITGRETRPTGSAGVHGWTWGALTAVVLGIGVALFVSRKPEPPSAAPEIGPAPSSLLPAPSNPSKADSKSIAVLPFTNLSTEKENEFFADGMHDEVITTLAKIRDLTVKSRTSVMAYKSGARNLRQIASELGVGTVLEATIQRAGHRVKLNVQLIDARTDAHLWSETYTEDTADLFAVQAKLAGAIASALRAQVLPSEQALIARRPTANQEAYDLYLRARVSEYGLAVGAPRADHEATIALYEQAVAKDPAFAVAHAKLSELHGLMYWFVGLDPSSERRARAEASLRVARQAAPDAPETILAEGVFEYRIRNDWAKAIEHYQRVEGDLPNDDDLQNHYGAALRRQGRWPEAVARFQRAVLLNPRSLAAHQSLGETLFALRRYADTERFYREAAAIFPDATSLHRGAARARLAQDGDVARYRASMTSPGSSGPWQPAFGEAMALGDLNAARRALERAPANEADGVLDPAVEPRGWQRALLAWHEGDVETARKLAADAQPSLVPNAANHLAGLYRSMATAHTCILLGRSTEARKIAQSTLAAAEAKGAFAVANFTRRAADVHAMLGDAEEALTLLRRAAANPTNYSAVDLRLSPVWAKLKADPRFEEILSSMKPL